MTTVVIVIHLLLAITMVAVILLQKSEGGGLGMGGGGGGGGGMGGFLSGRETANFLTRTTAFLATGFFATSLILAIMADTGGQRGSLFDRPAADAPAAGESVAAGSESDIPGQPKAPVAD
ncbi:MAG: preprotein translocase subunit SecG [Rhodospirillales bacterium]